MRAVHLRKQLKSLDPRALKKEEQTPQLKRALKELRCKIEEEEDRHAAFMEEARKGLTLKENELKGELVKQEELKKRLNSLRKRNLEANKQLERRRKLTVQQNVELNEPRGGLSKGEIGAFPSQAFEGSKHEICLGCFVELSKGERVKGLRCGHFYHAACFQSLFSKSRHCAGCGLEALEEE